MTGLRSLAYLADEGQVTYFEDLYKEWKLSLESRTDLRKFVAEHSTHTERFC